MRAGVPCNHAAMRPGRGNSRHVRASAGQHFWYAPKDGRRGWRPGLHLERRSRCHGNPSRLDLQNFLVHTRSCLFTSTEWHLSQISVCQFLAHHALNTGLVCELARYHVETETHASCTLETAALAARAGGEWAHQFTCSKQMPQVHTRSELMHRLPGQAGSKERT
jgi:hypothetical protein